MKLDGLIPVLYAALDVVSREFIGMIPSVSRDATADMVARNQKLTFPVTNKRGTIEITPGNEPVYTEKDFNTVDVVIDHIKTADPIKWNGEEYRAVGGQYPTMIMDQYTQAMRAIANDIERDLCFEAVMGAISTGHVYGTPGTTPFNGSLSDLSQVKKILDDAGSPVGGRTAVINTTAEANLNSLTNLTNVNKYGNDDVLRRGIITELLGFAVRTSGQFKLIDPGAGSGYLLNGVAAEGATQLIVDTGSGAINKGAIITIAGDSNKYIVIEDVASGGTVIKIAGGLKRAAADNAAITVGIAYLPSVAFSRDGVLLAVRQPYLPPGGDKAQDVTLIADPVSGLSFQVALYTGYLENRIEIRSAWGVKSINSEHSVALIG
jgi:hypothetical protein